MNHLTKNDDFQQLDPHPGFTVSLDKPLEWTSFDLVNKIRFHLKYQWKLKKLKVGHAGTLDPLATGLVIVGVGKGTKILDHWMNKDKIYSGTIKLGSTTASYDRETEETEVISISHLNEEAVLAAVPDFTGEFFQKPPIFSAIKKEGTALYKMARRGETTEIAERPVHIKELEILEYAPPFVKFRMRCSKGTYVRSFANDFGEALGVGGYLYDLRREQIGEQRVDEAFKIEEALEAFSLMLPMEKKS